MFFVSDGTGITAQMLGHSLLTQFEGVEFRQITLPFVDSIEKAEECLARMQEGAARNYLEALVRQHLQHWASPHTVQEQRSA